MHISRINSELKPNRLNAEYYSPQHLDDERLLSRFQTEKLDSLRLNSSPITYGILKPDGLGNNYRVAKAEKFEGMFLSHEDCEPVSKEMFNEYSRSEAKEGDVLIAIGGYVGRPAIVGSLPANCKLNVNRHLARLRVDQNKLDPYFLVGYLSCSIGNRQLVREVTGSVQAGINLEDLRLIDVPVFNPFAQKYIGEKVRQAERLRAWAKELVNRADSTISSQFEFSLVPSMRSQPRSISSELLSPVSLGPEFARASEGQATFSDSMKLEEYIDSCKCGDPIKSEDRVDGKYSYYGASGPIDKHNDYNFDGEYLIVAQDGSIGCANIARGKFWANNHVWVVKLNAAYDIDSVCRYLDEHFPYWKGVTTGSVVPKVTSENLLNVEVPIAIAKNEYIGDLLRLSSNATSLSSTLVNIAKLLVEDLIEGQVSEAELVAAQKTLDGGNESLDRALLERMTAAGIDGEGEPLFDDIDQLYDLLDQAKQALDAGNSMVEV